jgi:hypothetical protein
MNVNGPHYPIDERMGNQATRRGWAPIAINNQSVHRPVSLGQIGQPFGMK